MLRREGGRGETGIVTGFGVGVEGIIGNTEENTNMMRGLSDLYAQFEAPIGPGASYTRDPKGWYRDEVDDCSVGPIWSSRV